MNAPGGRMESKEAGKAENEGTRVKGQRKKVLGSWFYFINLFNSIS
jgi:hypothetical protein